MAVTGRSIPTERIRSIVVRLVSCLVWVALRRLSDLLRLHMFVGQTKYAGWRTAA
jgi:hypothetical protein